MRVHAVPHIDLIEGGEHGVSVLSILQPLCNPLPHAVHLHLCRYIHMYMCQRAHHLSHVTHHMSHITCHTSHKSHGILFSPLWCQPPSCQGLWL